MAYSALVSWASSAACSPSSLVLGSSNPVASVEGLKANIAAIAAGLFPPIKLASPSRTSPLVTPGETFVVGDAATSLAIVDTEPLFSGKLASMRSKSVSPVDVVCFVLATIRSRSASPVDVEGVPLFSMLLRSASFPSSCFGVVFGSTTGSASLSTLVAGGVLGTAASSRAVIGFPAASYASFHQAGLTSAPGPAATSKPPARLASMMSCSSVD